MRRPPVPVPPVPSHAPSPFVPVTMKGRILVLGVFAGVYTLVLVGALLNSTGASALVVLALGLYIGLRVVPLLAYRRSWGWFHPLVFGTVMALLPLLRRLGVLAQGIDYHVALPSLGRDALMGLVVLEMVLWSLGLAMYYFGFFASAPLPVPRLRFPRPRSLRRKVVLAVAFSGAVFLLYMYTQGGVVSHILSWGETRRVSLGGEYYWLPVIRVGAMACLVWLAFEPTAHRQPLFWLCAGLSVPILFLASGSRSVVVYTAIVGLMIWMLANRRISYVRVGLLALAALVVIGALGQFRTSTWRGQLDWSSLTALNPVERIQAVVSGELTTRVGSRSTPIAVLGMVPKQVDHLYGSTYLAVATLAVPRKVWPEKPMIADARAGEVFFGLGAGMVLGAMAEAFWNFNVVGVVLVFFGFGMFHRWLAAFYRRYSDEPAAIALFAQFLWGFQAPSSLDFISLMMGLVPLVGVLWAFGALRFSGGRAHAGARLAPPVYRPRGPLGSVAE